MKNAWDITAFLGFPLRVKHVEGEHLEEALDEANEILAGTFETKDFERYVQEYEMLPLGVEVLDFDSLDAEYYLADPLDENGQLHEDPTSREAWVDPAGMPLAYRGPCGIAANTAAIVLISIVEHLMEGDTASAAWIASKWVQKFCVKTRAGHLVPPELLDYIEEHAND